MNREILPMLVIVIMFALAYYADCRVLANNKGEIIGHWNLSGKPDGWISKSIGLYLLPFLTLVLFLVFLAMPCLELHKKNLEHFSDQFYGFKVVFVFSMAAIYVATVIPNMGYWNEFDPLVIIIPAVSLLFFYVGYMLNFTRQAHAPALAFEEGAWGKSNKIASELFWAAGILTFVALFSPTDYRLWFIMVPLIIVLVAVYLYSIMEYNKASKIHKEGQKQAKKKRK